MGASPDDGDSGADDGEEDEDNKEDDDDTGSDGDDDGKSDDKKDETVSKADHEKALARMRASDKRADEATARLKKIEDAKKDDLTRAQDDLKDRDSKLEAANKVIADLRLQNAFLSANKHAWHDPDTALAIAQSKEYLDGVVSDDGDVDKKALGKALDALAKDNSYLVKDASGAVDDKDTPPSGEPAGGRQSKGKKADAAEQQRLKTRFPALRNR
jgi:hypothetical protein